MAFLWLFVAFGYLLLYAFAAKTGPAQLDSTLLIPSAQLQLGSPSLDTLALARVDDTLAQAAHDAAPPQPIVEFLEASLRGCVC